MDEGEAKRRRLADKPGESKKHPIAAIQKRVIDSDAFAALAPSAVVVLLLFAKNLQKDRNGHVFLSQELSRRHGIAGKTLYRQLKALMAAGFIFQTKRGGYGNCARYALTWLPLSRDTKGLKVENFKPFAYQSWTATLKKKTVVKMSHSEGQKYRFIANRVDKNTVLDRTKLLTKDLCIPIASEREWIPAYLDNLKDSGLEGQQCFEIPPRVLQ